MNRIVNAAANLIFGILSTLYFLIENADIVIPGTIENGSFTGFFETILQVCMIVLIVLAAALCIYNLKVSKQLDGISKVGNYLSMVCEAACLVFLLIAGRVSILCILNILGAILIFIPAKAGR